MKKVCIITLYGNWNYGNKLQNYALQASIQKLGYEVTSLKNKYQQTLFEKIKYKIYKLRSGKSNISFKERENNFKQFNKKYMIYTPYTVTYTLSKKRQKEFDTFVIGSDQVWNYGDGTISKIMFGLFTNKEKNISYAASFGVGEIPEKYIPMYKKGLNNIESISVREEKGKKIVKQILDKNVPVVLDPTMLLEKKEWEKLEQKPNFLCENYIVTYFLGNLSFEKKQEIKNIALQNNLNVIELNNYQFKDYFDIGPSEFLYLFHHAKLVFTDSFHACVFSIIYNRPFFVYERDENINSMNSRIENLLKIFEEEKRFIKTIQEYKEDIFECNYEKTNQKFNDLKQKSIEFLKESLEK